MNDPLTEREIEVLRLLAENLTNREIGQELMISDETVKWYNKQIYSKLNVGSRAEAVARAEHLGLLVDADETVPDHRPRLELPAPVSSFIGRQQEISDLLGLLRTHRLVTLTGPGGTGKTRLGIEAATRAAAYFPDGVVFVGLASIADPSGVPGAIMQRLGLVELPGEPWLETIRAALSTKRLLLFLDNFEHVLSAAPTISSLLEAIPRLTVLATSRESLWILGEQEYPVLPLKTPDRIDNISLAGIRNNDAVQLFVERARAVSPSFSLTPDSAPAVAAISVRLDGLPLAIELAAARIKLFSPEQLLERLEDRLDLLTSGRRDAPARQRTLRDTIDWSYNLLDPGEKQLFARLGVFFGGRSIDAIEAICGPDLAVDLLGGLASLLNKSLLYQEKDPNGDPRFVMLETIHEYARERLADSGEQDTIRQRHTAYFLGLFEEMAPGYRQHGQIVLLNRTQAEMGNFRTAFDRALETGDVETAARLVSATSYFLFNRDHFVEGYRLVKRVLPHIDQVPERYQPPFLHCGGVMAFIHGEQETAREYFQQSAEIASELGDAYNESMALVFLAITYIGDPEEYDKAVELCESGLAIARGLGNLPLLAQGLNILGELARAQGDYELAQDVYNECLEVVRQTGEIMRENIITANLAFVAYEEGNYERALALFRQNTSPAVSGFSRQISVTALAAQAGPLAQLGQPQLGARLLGAAEQAFAELGATAQPADQHEIERFRRAVRERLTEEEYQAAYQAGQAMTFEEALALTSGDDAGI